MATGFRKLIVHGGAGDIGPERVPLKLEGVKNAVKAGYKVLERTDSALDAIEAAVRVMEDDPACNAGYGSCLTSTGEVEMDAIIIEGSDLRAGAVGCIKNVEHPISVARLVMEKTDHVLLCGDGALEFAKSQGIPCLPKGALVTDYGKATLTRVLSKSMAPTTELSGTIGFGTVGAVGMNSRGELGAATSTGGITGKLPGRVGDTPVIGGGTFCDNESCGVSATGHGEVIMRACLSSNVAQFVKEGMTGNQSCLRALENMSTRIPGHSAGAILITKDGQVGYGFNSKRMAWAYIDEGDKEGDKMKIHVGIDQGQDEVELWQLD